MDNFDLELYDKLTKKFYNYIKDNDEVKVLFSISGLLAAGMCKSAMQEDKLGMEVLKKFIEEDDTEVNDIMAEAVSDYVVMLAASSVKIIELELDDEDEE